MNLFKDLVSSIGLRIDGPEFVKDYTDSSAIIAELEQVAQAIDDKAVREELELDIRFIKAGDQGEKNVYYELKNSFIPMLVLHNVVVQYEDYKAQMDFVLITKKFICILETKKLNGNITINSDGDFVRSFVNQSGKVYKREGMYSPISQNQRHVRILHNLLLKEKVIKNTPLFSLVVIANPKSIIDFKYVKKELRDQIVKYDQLTARIKQMISQDKEGELLPTTMTRIADFLLHSHVEVADSSFVHKYKKQDSLRSVEYSSKLDEQPSVVADPLPVGHESVRVQSESLAQAESSDLREALVKFRLEQSRKENIKPYFIYNNKQMDCLIEAMPASPEELVKCEGFGEIKVQKYGAQILEILRSGRYKAE